ncbi:MAG: DUF1573 domain-containing protein [Bacteroidales bacterium]|nr:DUF1573 domain-containing protein [Bacteroidales bacterium]
MKRQILILIFLSAASVRFLPGQSDKAYIEFTDTAYDFGIIEESKGIVSHEFIFSNNGGLPLILSSVRPTCGCTTPEWTKEPVMPGKLGSINVSFNPKGRPGPFSKSITVFSNAANNSVVLIIKGYVRLLNDPFSEYKYTLGPLKLKSIHASMGTVYKGEIKNKIIEIANTSAGDPVKIEFKKIPEYLDIKISPEQLKPGGRGIIEVVFYSDKLDEWDYVITRLVLTINNQIIPDNMFTVTAVVREDFSKLTAEELNMSPKIVFENEKIDFGTIRPGQKIENEFILKNVGKTDLIIRKIRASCGCTAVEPDVKIIRPGKSTKIKTVFNSAGKSGKQKYAITVITNDPKNYKKILWLEGTVTKE